MFRVTGRASRPAWAWASTADPAVDFCVWVLLGDGLAVPPFADHHAGDGGLQRAGLTPDGWRTWLHATVGAQEVLADWIRSHSLAGLAEAERHELGRLHAAAEPPALWQGSPAVGELLGRLWVQYRSHGELWRREAASRIHPDGGLWKALDAARGECAGMFTAYEVRYPSPALELVPPAACVIAPGPDDPRAAYRRLALDAVRGLAAAARRSPGG